MVLDKAECYFQELQSGMIWIDQVLCVIQGFITSILVPGYSSAQIFDRGVPRRFLDTDPKKAKTDTFFKAQTSKMTPYSKIKQN